VQRLLDHKKKTLPCAFRSFNSWEETGKPLENGPLKMKTESKDVVS